MENINIDNRNLKFSNNSRYRLFSKEDLIIKQYNNFEENKTENIKNTSKFWETIHNLTIENKKLKEEILLKNKEKFSIDKENWKLIKNKSNLKFTFEEIKKENILLKEEITDFKIKINNLENFNHNNLNNGVENENLLNKIKLLKFELESKNKIILEFKNNDIHTHNKLIEDKELLVKDIDILRVNFDLTMKEKNENIDSLENIIENFEHNYEIYQTELENKNLQLKKYEAKLINKKEKINKINKELLDITNKNIDLKNKISIINNTNLDNNNYLKDKINNYKNENMVLNSQILNYRKNISILNNKNKELKDINEAYESEFQNKNNDEYITFLEKENEEYKISLKETDNYNKNLDSMKFLNSELSNKIEILEKEIKEKNVEIEIKNENIFNLESEISQLFINNSTKVNKPNINKNLNYWKPNNILNYNFKKIN